MTPMTAAALSSVPVDKAGVGSGMLNTFRQVGGSLGIAVMGAILASGSNSALADGADQVEAFMNGLHHALYVAAAIAFAGAAVAFLTVRSHARSQGAVERAAPGAGMSQASQARLPAAERRSAIVAAALEVFGSGSYAGSDDGRDRPRGRGLRADHLPPFRVEARALVRVPRRGLARLRTAIEQKGGRPSRRRAPSRAPAPESARRGRARCCRISGCRASPRRPRTRRSSATCAPTCARYTTSSPT